MMNRFPESPDELEWRLNILAQDLKKEGISINIDKGNVTLKKKKNQIMDYIENIMRSIDNNRYREKIDKIEYEIRQRLSKMSIAIVIVVTTETGIICAILDQAYA